MANIVTKTSGSSMANTTLAGAPFTAKKIFKKCALISFACACIVVFAIYIQALCPQLLGQSFSLQKAYAANYTVEQDSYDATLDSAGNLSITETRIYHFDIPHTLVGRIMAPSGRGDVTVSGVSISAAGQAKQTLSEVPFQTSWRESGGPGQTAYSIDKQNNTIYTFGDYSDTVSVSWTYVYTNVVTRYNDTSELYWQVIGKNEEVAISNVKLTLHLPNEAGQEIKAGDNVRAWGHGSLTGNVEISDVINYTCPKVSPGDFAELRVLYPVEWASQVSADCIDNTNNLDHILNEEKSWADDANSQRNSARTLQNVIFWAFMIFPPILFIAALFVYWRFGREHKTKFQGKYWRDVPANKIDPCVVGRICRWNKTDPADLTAQLMDLTARDVISLKPTTETKKKLLGGEKQKETLALVWNDPDNYEGLSSIDKCTLRLIFRELAKADSVTAERLKEIIKSDRETAVHYLKNWQETLTEYVDAMSYFEEKSKFLFGTFAVISTILAAAVLVLFFLDYADGSYIPLMPVAFGSAFVFSIATIILSFQIRRRSVQAAEIAAKSKALKKWFKDFTNLKEAIPTDVKVWGRLLVYASLFGVADEVIKSLKLVAPDLFNDDWFLWYLCWSTPAYGHTGFNIGSSFSDAFGGAIAASNNSSATGAGGGFSGGGGGGFGGGGGGFAR